MKTQSTITRTLSIIFALLVALVMATGCGNIAGTNFNNARSVTPAQSTTAFSNVQAPANGTLSPTPYGSGDQPIIIQPKPN